MGAGSTGRRRAAPLLAAALAAGLLAGCAGSGPFGGGGQAAAPAVPARAAVAGLPVAEDGTVLVPRLRTASADRGRQGVILRAEGIAPTHGFFAPELRPVAGPDAGGVLTVEMRAAAPAGPETVGTDRSRILSAGRFFPNHEMRAIRGFRIVTVSGTQTVTAP